MSDQFSEDAMEELAADEAEGPAAAYDSADDSDGGDEFLRSIIGGVGRIAGGLLGGGGNEFDELDEYDEGDEGDEGDALDEFDAGDDELEEGDYASFEDAVADALEAEDTDEFFRRIARVARQVGRGVGRVARVVAPIASTIPIPQAQAVGRVAQVLGRVLADGADEFDALEDVYDQAEADDSIDAAAPLIAGLALRSSMPAIRRASAPVRRALVRSASAATRNLARTQGPQAARALRGVVQRVQRGVRQRQIPARRAPQAIRTLARRAARNPRAVRALARQGRVAPRVRRPGVRGPVTGRAAGSRPSAAAVSLAGSAVGRCRCGRRIHNFALRGPVQVSIRGR